VRLGRELGLPAGAPVVGAVGRLGRQKGYDVFIRAAGLIRRDRPDVHFLLVGKGPYETQLRELVSRLRLDDCFHFTGERDDALDIFPLIDVFVMSSRWEAMPYALLEAMAAARAIVLSRVSGLDKVVEYGRAAVIIPPEDPEALRREVVRLLEDEARRKELGRRAREIAVAGYRLADAVREIESLYDEVRHER
jgi:glycosyltransferase involved in cell wall biosynthesis